MEPMSVELPATLKQFVDERVDSGGFGTASEYLRQLIEADKRRAAKEWLEREILEGLDSGDPIPVTEEFWQSLRDEVINRHAARNGGGETR